MVKVLSAASSKNKDAKQVDMEAEAFVSHLVNSESAEEEINEPLKSSSIEAELRAEAIKDDIALADAIEGHIRDEIIGTEEDLENFAGSLLEPEEMQSAKEKLREERLKTADEILDIKDKVSSEGSVEKKLSKKEKKA